MSKQFYAEKISAESVEFLTKKHSLFINNEWVDSSKGEVIDVFDPANGEFLTTIAAASEADVNTAVESASSAMRGEWSQLSGLERGKLISKFAFRMEELADELAEIEAVDCGKPLAYAKFVDVGLTTKTYHYMAGWASKVNGETVAVSGTGEAHAYTRREPVGVVAQIIPWNFPLVLLAYKLAPSLAAGCTAVIKPAEDASLSTLRLAEIAKEVGFPPGVINIVTGYGNEAGNALVKHKKVDKVAFTGSTKVGKQIIKDVADDLKRVTVELGGKAPMVVFSDADLEKTIPGLAMASFFHQGQVCTAGTRLYVHESVHDAVVDGLKQQATLMKTGHGLEEDSTFGPLISMAQVDQVAGYVEKGVASGANLELGGKKMDRNGYFFEPTILTGTTNDMEIVQEEIFGPVLCVIKFTDEDDLDALADVVNDNKYGLAASIWTENTGKAHKMASRIKAGSVWINAHHSFDPALPFGGFKQSGWGREQGSEAIKTFTEVKSVCITL